ncbi:MAG: hypothetical protein JXQ96_23275 [Cyclobacteriaceae bacterium]
MVEVRDILKHKTLLLVTGILIAFALVAGPVIRDYVQCEVTAKCEQSDKQDDEKPETKVSSFDAVALVLQLNFNLNDLLFEVLNIEYITTQISISDELSERPQKLLQILFRRIISPNAP